MKQQKTINGYKVKDLEAISIMLREKLITPENLKKDLANIRMWVDYALSCQKEAFDKVLDQTQARIKVNLELDQNPYMLDD